MRPTQVPLSSGACRWKISLLRRGIFPDIRIGTKRTRAQITQRGMAALFAHLGGDIEKHAETMAAHLFQGVYVA